MWLAKDSETGWADVTLDEAVDTSACAIDAILEQRLDALVLEMIACGADPERVSDVLDDQRAVDTTWRATTLAALRAWLLTWDEHD